MTAICYRCLHVHEASSRVTCTNCNACKHKPIALRHRKCLRKICPSCGGGTYWSLT